MIVAIPKETAAGETRVAMVPALAKKLISKHGWQIEIQSGAGDAAGFPDAAYVEAGASIVPDVATLCERADVVLYVQTPTLAQIDQLRSGSALLSFLWPLQNHDLVNRLTERKITAFAMDSVPRITRAQSMDALSAMSTISGYKAVLLAATEIGRFCPMLMTAAGTIRPAKALILGAGVAGLTAIATCRRLGCIVEAFDVRPAVKEQVESLGAKFVEFVIDGSEDAGGYAKALDEDQATQQLKLIHKHIVTSNIVITTALIPGRKAPVLVTDDMLKDMQQGAVVVDLAAISGGNCEGTQPDQTVVRHGVTIIGPTNLPATVQVHASEMYSKVITNLLAEISNEEGVQVDMENNVTQGCVVTHDGEVLHERTRSAMGLPERQAPAEDASKSSGDPAAPSAP